MKVGILQFGPQLYKVDDNKARADALLEGIEPGDLDLLVLPELALTGYNYTSLEDIRPYLEPTASGTTAEWARRTASRLQCLVSVGYPEISRYDGYPKYINGALRTEPLHVDGPNSNGESENRWVHASHERTYNSILTVDSSGHLLAHYRKTNLFYTDASWSWPNPTGFEKEPVQLPLSLFSVSEEASLHRKTSAAATTPTSFAICMDFNPTRFTAPWDDYELANHIKRANARLLIACNAWLTHLSQHELQSQPHDPDNNTITYWVTRLKPLIDHDGGWKDPMSEGVTSHIEKQGQSTSQLKELEPFDNESTYERICVIANRTGIEPGEVKACDLNRGRPPTAEETREAVERINEQVSAEAAAGVEGRAEEGTEPTISRPIEDSSETPGAATLEARYAGSSCVIGLRGDGSIRMYGGLGRAQEKVLIVNTDSEPYWLGRLAKPDDHEE